MLEYYEVVAAGDSAKDRVELKKCQKSVFDDLFSEAHWTGVLDSRENQAWETYRAFHQNLFRLKAAERAKPRLAEDLAVLIAWNSRPLDEEIPEMGFSLADLATAMIKIQQTMLVHVDKRAKDLAVDNFNNRSMLEAARPLLDKWKIEQYANYINESIKKYVKRAGL